VGIARSADQTRVGTTSGDSYADREHVGNGEANIEAVRL
jgi:hypothetical protein